MKITSLSLRGFRSGVSLTLNTDSPRVLISGGNGVGKSSIRDAVAWTLQGKCSGTDGRGLGWEGLIPTGTTTLAVGLTLGGIGSIEREHRNGTRSLLVEGFTGESSIQQQALFTKLNVSPAYLDACLDSGAFLGLQHAPAKALVLDLLQVRIPVGEELLTLDQLDSRYRQAFEERKMAKSKAKSFTVPPKPADSEPMPPVAAVEAKLKEVRAELHQLSLGAGETAGKRQLLTNQLGAATNWSEPSPDAVDPAYIADLEERLAIMEADVTAEPIDPFRQAGKTEMTAVVGAWHEDNSRQALQNRIHVLTEHKPKQGCVLDNGVSCDTAKIKFSNHVKVLKQQLDSLPSPSPATTPAKPALPSTPSPLQATRKALDEAKARHAEFVAVEARNAAKRVEAEAIQAQLASLKDDAEVTAAIEGLKVRIGKGELLLKRASDYWREMERYSAAARQKEELEAKVNQLEMLCDLLGPNGARVDALNAAIDPFVDKINRFTQVFGWTIDFTLDPWRVLVNGRAVETWSESEQFRIGIALQLAIAELSGLSFAIVDRLDMLDVKNRNAVASMLMQAPLEQILIIATREPEQALPNVDGVLAYRLSKTTEGRTEVSEATGQ